MIYKSAWLAPNNTSSRAWNCLLYHILLDNCFCDCFSIFAKGKWLIWMCVKGHYRYCGHEAKAAVLGSIFLLPLVHLFGVLICETKVCLSIWEWDKSLAREEQRGRERRCVTRLFLLDCFLSEHMQFWGYFFGSSLFSRKGRQNISPKMSFWLLMRPLGFLSNRW